MTPRPASRKLFITLAAIATLATLAATTTIAQPQTFTAPILTTCLTATTIAWLSLTTLAFRLLKYRADTPPLPLGEGRGEGILSKNTTNPPNHPHPKPPPDSGHWTTDFRLLLTLAIALRLFTVFTTTPTLSDDIWRYIHDGATLASGVSPYAHAPAELTGDTAPHPPLLEHINHPHLVTIYQPTSQYVFAALWLLTPQTLDPLGDKTFRLGFIFLDIIVLLTLIGILKRRHHSPWFAALYALHPLAIIETAASGHQDVIALALLLPCFAAIDIPHISTRRVIIAAALFALAVAVKPIALPLAAVLAWHVRRRPRHLLIAAATAALVGLALYLPFLLAAPGLARLFDTSRQFVDAWAFNSSIHVPLAEYFSRTVANGFTAAVLSAVIIFAIVKNLDLYRAALAYCFAALLLSSTCHPWYMLWPLAFLPLAFNAALWYWSAAILLTYTALLPDTPYRVPAPIAIIEYAPVYLLLALAAVRNTGFARTKPPTTLKNL